MAKCKWLESLQESQREIKEIVNDLYSLSHTFERTGNGQIAQELYVYAVTLEENAEKIRKASGQAVGDWVGSIKQGTFNMVSLALDMADRRDNSD